MWCSLAIAGGGTGLQRFLELIGSEMKSAQLLEARGRAIAWLDDHEPVALNAKRTAAESGDAVAQSELGELYHRLHSYDRALRWFRASADQGYSFGQYNLGVMYFEGSGLTRDDSEAAQWFVKAAEQWNPLAMNNLAVLYASGRGVAKDPVAAYVWLKRAIAAGDSSNASTLDAMRRSLVPLRLSEAESRVEAWLAAHPKPE